MLTESEILDEQVQTLDEVLDKLTECEIEGMEPKTVPDLGDSQVLQVTVECLKATVDLYQTISSEGVSASDIKALRHIRERMAPHMTLTYVPALEAYEGMFTPTRSMVNQVVSQEATLEEIGITLKEWFFKFIDFVIKLLDWSRSAWNTEFAIKKRLMFIDDNLQSMYNAFEDTLKWSNKVGRDYTAQLNAIWEQVLLDPKLNRSPSMLYAFGMTTNVNAYTKANKIVDDSYRLVLKDITALKMRVEKDQPMLTTYMYGNDINDAAFTLEQLTVADSKVSYLSDQLPSEYWRKPRSLLERKVQAPSAQITQVQEIAKQLRDIKRNSKFNDLKDSSDLVSVVENLTAAIKGLERIIAVKQALFVDFYKASATMATFYIRGHDLMNDDLMKHDSSDSTKIAIDRMSKTWEDICSKMGL